jgi:hypothetical protein
VTSKASADFAPSIEIQLDRAQVLVRQNRPQVTQSLRGVPINEALRIVPSLLPVCGVAQAIAASRASSAARQRAFSQDQLANQANALWREQALAAVWRLTIDWPDLLQQPRDLKTLKRARQSSSDAELANILKQLLPGLEAISTVEQLLDWSTRESGCAATLARRAREAGASQPDDPRSLCSGEELQGRARRALTQAHYDSCKPQAEPTTTGPLAMARSGLVRQLRTQLGNSSLTRLLAMIIDSQLIAETLANAPASETAGGQREIVPGTGLGWATTARGPVFHQIALDEDQSVADWRVLAPTDWHFTPQGPLVKALTRVLHDGESEECRRLTVASFDPCAPWTLTDSAAQASDHA